VTHKRHYILWDMILGLDVKKLCCFKGDAKEKIRSKSEKCPKII